jgi:hypothetical protein
VGKRCYLWAKQSATADVCFTARPDSATSTSFTVLDFETMLKSVHANVVADQATSGCNNKWLDNRESTVRFCCCLIEPFLYIYELS